MSRISWVHVDRNKIYGAAFTVSFEIRKAILGCRLFDRVDSKWNLVGNFATVEAAQHEAEDRIDRGVYASRR